MAHCTNCGHELQEEAQFCSNCGAPVIAADAPAEPPVPAQEPDNTQAPSSAVQVPLDARNMATLAHLSAFAGYIIPFGNIAGPLLVWLLKREDSPFIDAHGKEALNFQISMTIYFIVCFILIFVFIGIFLFIGLVLLDIIAIIMATVRAGSGQEFRYPLTMRFIK